MNYNLLIGTLMSLLFQDSPRSYDPIEDFRTMIKSPELVTCVLDHFKKNIEVSITEIHNNFDVVRIELQKTSFRIIEKNKLVYEQTYGYSFNSLKNDLIEKLEEFTKLNKVLFSFNVDHDVSQEMQEGVESAVDYLLTFGSSSLFILETNKDEMFNLRNIKRKNSSIQYFYTFENKYYCAFIKDYKSFSAVDCSYDTMVYYFLKRIPDIKVDEQSLKSYRKYTGRCEHSKSFEYYQNYILTKAMENVSSPNEYFHSNILRTESNNFFMCLDVFIKSKIIKPIMEKYVQTLPEDQIQKLAEAFCRLCICEPNKWDARCHCGKSNQSEDIDMVPCKTLSTLFPDLKALNLKNPTVAVLRSFFDYVLRNHIEEIMFYKEDFLKIIYRRTLETLNLLFLNFQKKVTNILMYYNIRKEEPLNEHWGKLFEILDEQLNSKERRIINKF